MFVDILKLTCYYTGIDSRYFSTHRLATDALHGNLFMIINIVTTV